MPAVFSGTGHLFLLLVVVHDRVAAGRVAHELGGRLGAYSRLGRRAQAVYLARDGVGVGHEPERMATARTSCERLAGSLGVIGSFTTAVPTHALTSDRSVVFV